MERRKNDRIVIDEIDKDGNEIPLKRYTKQYLISEGYLFALKHYLEQEQYPIRSVTIDNLNGDEFKKRLNDSNNIEETIKEEIRSFHDKLEKEVYYINNRKKKEKVKILELERLIEQYKEIFLNIDKVSSLYREVIEGIENVKNEIDNIEVISIDDIYNLDKYLKKYNNHSKLIETTVNTQYHSQKKTIVKLENRQHEINKMWAEIYSSINDIKDNIEKVFMLINNEGYTFIKARFINLGYLS